MGRKNRFGMRMIAMMLICCGLLSGCGSSGSSGSFSSASGTASNSAYDSGSNVEYAAAPEAGMDMNEDITASGGEGKELSVAKSRKLIKNVDLTVETEGYDKLLGTVESKVTELGGYVEFLDSYEPPKGSRETRNTNITARIPVDRLAKFITMVDQNANVTKRTETVKDVTLEYVDLESHKKMLQLEQTSLLKLLENAESLEDIITIEGRLSEVRYQLESMEAQLRTYDNLVDYSTVTLAIQEVERLTPVEEKSAWSRIRTGFSENVYLLFKGIGELGIGIIINLPYILLLAAIGAIILLIVEFSSRRGKKRRAACLENAGTAQSGRMYGSYLPQPCTIQKPEEKDNLTPENPPENEKQK